MAGGAGCKEPRDFKIDPSGRHLVVGHQISDDVFVFAIDPSTGKLQRQASSTKLSKVVNFAFWSGAK